MIVYHGTTMEIQKPDIKHSKAHLDFGEGFYTTTFLKQAERWAYRKGMRLSHACCHLRANGFIVPFTILA